MERWEFQPEKLTNVEKIIYESDISSRVELSYLIGINRIYYPAAQRWIIYSPPGRGNLVHHHQDAAKLCRDNQANVLLYDYPGFGYSTGQPSEKAVVDCLYRLLSEMMSWVEEHNITLMGRGLGAGVVMGVVDKLKWRQPVVLISPFCSLGELYLPLWLCWWNSFNNYERVKAARCSVKIYAGIYDTEVKPYHGERFEKLKNVRLVWLPATHDSIIKHRLVITQEE